MKIIVKTLAAQCALTISGIFIDNAVNLQFSNPSDSHSAFETLRGNGIRCYHVGENAPHGPYVAIYEKENSNLTIKSK